MIIQQGIKVLQQKLAGLIQALGEGDSGAGMNGDFGGPRSPEYQGGDAWQDQGYTTPYGNGGAQSSWGNVGGATPYGTATPYGQPGQSGWS